MEKIVDGLEKKIPKKCFLKKTCKWVRRGKCLKRQLCCDKSSCCGKPKCKWASKAVHTDCVKEKCKMKKVGKCLYRKICCDKKGKSCRWSGRKIAFNCKRICVIKKFNKCNSRKRCCHEDGSKCKWVGKLNKRIQCQHFKCQFRKVGNCKRRRYCCKGRKCFWRGKMIQRKNCKLPEDCRLKKVGKCYERKRCCIGTKCRWDGESIKIQGCGPVSVHNQVCLLYADPHVRSLKGAYFNAQTVGDWLLYKGDNLEVHYRGKSRGSWVAMVKVGIIVDGKRLTTRDFSFNLWNFNGENVNIKSNIDLGRATIKKKWKYSCHINKQRRRITIGIKRIIF